MSDGERSAGGPAPRDRRETVEKVLNVLRDDVSDMPKTGTAGSSTTATRSRPATSTSLRRSSATSRCARTKRASRAARSRCTRGQEDPRLRADVRARQGRERGEQYLDGCSRVRRTARPSSRALTQGKGAVAVALVVAPDEGASWSAGPKTLVELGGRPMLCGASRRCAPLTPSPRSCRAARGRRRAAGLRRSGRGEVRSASVRAALRPPRRTATRCWFTTAPARS